MPNDLPPSVTRLLMNWSDGDADALTELMPLVCDELRQMARRSLGRESAGHTLQPTALVNEFFLRIEKRRTVTWKNREQFFGHAGRTMRLILVDHARRQQRKKRGSGEAPVALGPELEQIPAPEGDFEIVEVHEALERLEQIDPRAAQVVELRFFVGMSVKEAAAALETSPATVKRDWQFARLWLYRELQGTSSDPVPETPTAVGVD
ncbi:MAG: sigma-70 family RNA polymerase sigma factor [bacterium]|nr:sigma-70 family RNA polymerase sigma factor [bacterium]